MWALSVCWVLLGTLGAGSAQLTFQKIDHVDFDACNKSKVTIPCIVTNLETGDLTQMFVKWKLNGQEFFAFDGYENKYYKNDTFYSVELLDIKQLTSGVASIRLTQEEALPGNYTCNVVEKTREGEQVIKLQYGSPFWFQPRESLCIIATAIAALVLFLLQVVFVALKFEMGLLKKISCGVTALIVMIIAANGAVLLVREGHTTTTQSGLGLVVFPTVFLVPPLYFLFRSVFEKPPLFAIILVALKALGYLIAVAGFATCVTACPPKQASLVIAGLGIIDTIGVIAFIYMVVIGTSFKDHQPPKKAVEEPLNDAKGVMLE